MLESKKQKERMKEKFNQLMSFDLDSEFKRIHEEVYTEKTKPVKKEEAVDKATLIERYNASFHLKER